MSAKIHSFDDFLAMLKGVKRNGNNGWLALCPGHNDREPSLSIKESDGKILVKCFAGCELTDILKPLGLDPKDLFPDGHKTKPGQDRRLVATFSYCDIDGKELYQIRRYEPKDFNAWHKEGSEYAPGLGKNKPILYHLPEIADWIADDKRIYDPEGEAKADIIIKYGGAATTSPFGAGNNKWKPEYSEALAGAEVIILPDNDKPGRDFAQAKAASLYGIAKSIKILELPGLPEKGDIIDWFNAGGTFEQLEQLGSEAQEWKPPSGVAQAHFCFTKLRDLLGEPDEEIAYLWKGTLIRGGLSTLVAKPKVGKSTLARNLALKVAKGDTEFLGRAITASGPVVYLALEEKRSEVKKHFERMGATDELPIFVHTGSAPEKAIDELRKAITGNHAVMAIVDPLQRLVRISDLNDYSLVSLALEPLMQIARDTDCHILLIHHATKGINRESGDSILGSTAIFGSVDCALIMKRGESYRTIESFQRYGEDLLRTVLAFDVGTGLTSSGGSLEDVQVAECGKAILELLDHEMTEKEIKDGITDYKGGIVSKSLRLLCQEGKVQRHGLGKKGDPYLYAAVPKNAGDSRDSYIEIPTIPRINSSFKNDLNAGDVASENTINANPQNLESQTVDHREVVLGMPVEKAIELWRSEGAPWIYLGPGENCEDLVEELSNPDVSERHLKAIRAWLDKVLQRRSE